MSVPHALGLIENDFVICFVVGEAHADLWSVKITLSPYIASGYKLWKLVVVHLKVGW